MKLASIITGSQTVSLISESDTHAALSLVDQRTGEVKRLDISADMAVLPDEALLSVKVRSFLLQPGDLAGWWARGDATPDLNCPECGHAAVFNGGDRCMAPSFRFSPIASNCMCQCPVDTQDEEEPESYWTITPDGQEIDLRVREGGLF